MTPTTTDRDPDPTLAAACLRCGRVDGYVRGPECRPERVQGYCSACYSSLWYLVDQRRFADVHQANAAVPYTGRPDTGRAERHAHSRAQLRTWARETALRQRPGPVIAVTSPTGRPIEECVSPSDFDGLGNGGGACDPPWQPASWYAPLATEDVAA